MAAISSLSLNIRSHRSLLFTSLPLEHSPMREDAFHLQPALSSTNKSSPSKKTYILFSSSSSFAHPAVSSNTNVLVSISSSLHPGACSSHQEDNLPSASSSGKLMSWSRQGKLTSGWGITIRWSHITMMCGMWPKVTMCEGEFLKYVDGCQLLWRLYVICSFSYMLTEWHEEG